MSGKQLWEVVGGGDKGGIVAREGKDLKSAECSKRLATGALVQEVELVGERLHFELLQGDGPATGWVSLALKDKPLVEKSSKSVRPKPVPNSVQSVAPTQCPQTAGQPFVFYHQISFLDTKPTGLRMSGAFGCMDECRMDMHSGCDVSAEGLRELVDPHVELGMELLPAIKVLGHSDSCDGMIYTHPQSRGAVMSWLRVEAEFAFPLYPFKTEEQNIYLVGKQKDSSQRLHVARARFLEVFMVDKDGVIANESYEPEVEMFYARTKQSHAAERLKARPLRRLYSPENKPFTPTVYGKATWLMSAVYADLWGLHYHGRTSEVIWEVNMLAGGKFAELVKDEPDPQAMAVGLPKRMDFGKTFDAHCFLEESRRRGVYILLPKGSLDLAEVVLCVCCRYDWEDVPEDGKTLCSEDFDVVSRTGLTGLMKFATQGDEAKSGKIFDTTKLPRP